MIEALNVGKVHERGEQPVEALMDVSLRVEPGEFVAVRGPSGSGKTTLLSLLGLLDTPSSGKITVDGVDASTMNETERATLRRRHIGFVFQFFNLLPALTATENVLVPAMLEGKTGNSAGRAEELLCMVGVADRAAHRPEQLSGGEQQRVAIARALIADPAVVLADEPTGNLDSTTGAQVLDVLISATQGSGRSLVVVTHDAAVGRRADRVVELRDGRTPSAQTAGSPA